MIQIFKELDIDYEPTKHKKHRLADVPSKIKTDLQEFRFVLLQKSFSPKIFAKSISSFVNGFEIDCRIAKKHFSRLLQHILIFFGKGGKR